MGVFETSDQNGSRSLQPVRVPTLKQDIFGQARELCSDLDGWDVVEVDEANLKITCKRANGLLGGTSQILVWVEGPDRLQPERPGSFEATVSGGEPPYTFRWYKAADCDAPPATFISWAETY